MNDSNMEITYDYDKNVANIEKHGLSFELVTDCDWERPLIMQDTRFDYGEVRFNALVPLNKRLCNVVYTVRDNTMRIISFRKANSRERKFYEQKIH